jgi:site-specific DNA-methyltransferase (adenine-specific)/adenine-specific DNA-methyltransferase
MPTLDWIGKDAVRKHHQDVPFHLLREDESRAVGDADADNMLIQGDNLKALKALLPHYAGEVKCIYIDPPYNTGNEDWAYNDNVNSPEIRRWLNEVVGKEGEDLSRHDKWLCMMYPRLMLLREFLAEDGSLWMTIDDNEVHHARAILDEIFGRRNFKAMIAWQKRTSPDSRINLGSAHDHILVYAKKKEKLNLNLVPLSGARASDYTNPDNDPNGRWASVDMTGQTGHATEDQFYEIETPDGTVYKPPEGRCWAYAEETFLDLIDQGRVWFGEDGSNRPRLKKYLKEAEGMTTWTWWTHDKVAHNQEAKKELNQIIDDPDAFNTTPKPTRLIKRILHIATDPGDLVLDSFAGSGTTGHAVLQKNEEDEGGRRFILVEIEKRVAEKVAFHRLKRVVEGYEYEGKERETLMEREIKVRDLKKGDQIYSESEQIKERHIDQYDKIRREMKDGTFRLYGETTIEDHKDGLGSGFRYYTLGPVIKTSDLLVSDDVTYDDLARHVYFAETGRAMPKDASPQPPLVTTEDGTAIYLLYGTATGDGQAPVGNVLTREVLASLPAPGDVSTRIVYGEAHRLGEQELKERGIIFRQIPYDVRTT